MSAELEREIQPMSDERTVVQQVTDMIELAIADPDFVEREWLAY